MFVVHVAVEQGLNLWLLKLYYIYCVSLLFQLIKPEFNLLCLEPYFQNVLAAEHLNRTVTIVICPVQLLPNKIPKRQPITI